MLMIMPLVAKAQVTLSGDIFQYIENTIANMPGSDGGQFANMLPFEEEDWRDLLDLLVDRKYADVAELAPDLGYRLVRYMDINGFVIKEFYILEKAPGGNNYWGTYIFNPNICRNLVIQSPHPKYDSNTGVQGIHIFRNINAYAYFLSGTHRCNDSSASGCSGTTTACGASSPYRRSDVAHNTLSAFHIATEVVHDQMPELTFVQLHGFAKQSSDPFVIMSNGTRDAPPNDYALAIRNGLLDEDPGLTFRIGHIDLSWDRLLGGTNTQGRYINGSTDACTQNAEMSDGRFIHIEQEFSRLRASESLWDKMLAALSDAFPCMVVATDEVEEETAALWYLQTDGSITFRLPPGNRYELRVFNWLGQTILSKSIDANETIQLGNGLRGGFLSVWSDGALVQSGKWVSFGN